MSVQIEHENPMVTKTGIFDMQICAPEGWEDEQIEAWANKENPAGTEHGWRMKHNGEDSLSGCHERVTCAGRPGFVHVMFQC